MINICARRAKTATSAAYQRNGKVSYCKGSIFALLRSFFHYSKFSLLIRLFNATHAKITYLCNRFGLLCSMIIPTSATRTEIDSLTPNLRKCFLFAKN